MEDSSSRDQKDLHLHWQHRKCHAHPHGDDARCRNRQIGFRVLDWDCRQAVRVGRLSVSPTFVFLRVLLLDLNTTSRFFYAAERTEDGKDKGAALDGPAHGDFYAHLASNPDLPCHATFVKDKGYVSF